MEGEKMLDSLNDNDNNIIIKDDENQEEEEVQLPGFRFHPTDEELVGFYLKRKVEKKPIFIDHLITHVDIYKYDPWDLPKAGIGGEKEWYFFCKRGRKYKNSVRPNRVTGSGFWKATGIDKPIYSPLGCIGLKKSLVYYRGIGSKGTKTDWMMHEFRLPASEKTTNNMSIDAQMMIMISNNVQQEAEIWTLCRIFKREVSYKRYASDCRQKTRITGKAASHLDCSKQRDNYNNNLSYEVLAAMGRSENFIMPAVNYDHHNLLSFASHDQLSFNTTQYPVMAAASLLTGDECFREENWDELRPMIHFARP